jgi:hypothetical protein
LAQCCFGWYAAIDQFMHSPVAAGAEHGEVLGLGCADAARKRDAVVCLDQV